MRKLTISYSAEDKTGRTSIFPMIRIKGKWLETLGWSIGEKIEVEASSSEITIRKSCSAPAAGS